MVSSHFKFEAQPGLQIHVRKFLPEPGKQVLGVVLISHGLSEHAGRYERFAGALTTAGYAVYAPDQRGHGITGGSAPIVHLKPGDFEGMADDLERLRDIAVGENPNLPIFLFGHSLGTVISRKYLQKYSGRELCGAILCGPVAMPEGVMPQIATQASALAREHGAGFVDLGTVMMLFGSFNDKIQPLRTPSDWLSRDEAEVDKYIADPCCGQPQTVGFYEEFAGTYDIEKPTRIALIAKSLPVLFITGGDDPVSNYAEGAKAAVEAYKKAGIRDVSLIVYPGARHELLNETNREEVTDDVIRWFDSHL